MALTGWLETDNLLVVIASLLGLLNFNQSRIKGLLSSISKYIKKDIEIRSRLERKANYLMRKMGVDVEAFDTATNIDYGDLNFDD